MYDRNQSDLKSLIHSVCSPSAGTPWVVLPAMGVEVATALALAVLRWGTPDAPLALAGPGLLGVIWASTALVQAPLHGRLVSGFDAEIHRRLVRSNWVRTLAWGFRGVPPGSAPPESRGRDRPPVPTRP
jgi:hypothetical protein